MAEFLFWPALLFYGEAAVGLSRRRAAAGLRGARRHLGRAPRLARADGAARRAGRARGRLSVGHVGGLAQPLRLARRRRVSDLGLPQAVPPARPRRDAARRRAPDRLARRRRHRRRAPQPLLEPLPRPARRSRARRLRRLHARRRALGALSLAGAAAQAARDDDPAPAGALARDARPARRPHRRGLASPPSRSASRSASRGSGATASASTRSSSRRSSPGSCGPRISCCARPV